MREPSRQAPINQPRWPRSIPTITRRFVTLITICTPSFITLTLITTPEVSVRNVNSPPSARKRHKSLLFGYKRRGDTRLHAPRGHHSAAAAAAATTPARGRPTRRDSLSFVIRQEHAAPLNPSQRENNAGRKSPPLLLFPPFLGLRRIDEIANELSYNDS